MKHHLYILLCLFLTVYLSVPTNTIIATANPELSSLINSYEEDITGDGFKEHLSLKGNLLTEKSNFYKDVWIDITSPFSHQWKVLLENGYDPQLQLIDLNHDQTFDLFYSAAKDENKQQHVYRLYTINNGNIKQLTLPKHNHVQGKFLDDFKVEIKINPQMKAIIKDISKNKKHYIEETIYEEDGTLIKPKTVTLPPISHFEPTLISKSKGYGLKSVQTVKGINEQDFLGQIESLWYYRNEEWIILKTEWIEVK